MHSLVDLDDWNRKDVFGFFRDFEDPFFNVTVTLDVTVLVSVCKGHDLAFSSALLYFSQKAANQIREFKIRLLDGRLVEYERVEATQTVLLENEAFSFCYLPEAKNLRGFVSSSGNSMEHYKKLRTFDVESDRVDLIYYSILPWLSFTSFKHATRSTPGQTVPRIAFGKYTAGAGERIHMPVSVEVNHAIMDGIHVGKYISLFQQELDEADSAV
jgi:chloramphenicol O-acetyltransferase type A